MTKLETATQALMLSYVKRMGLTLGLPIGYAVAVYVLLKASLPKPLPPLRKVFSLLGAVLCIVTTPVVCLLLFFVGAVLSLWVMYGR